MLGIEPMKRTGGAIVNITSTATLNGNYDLYGAGLSIIDPTIAGWLKANQRTGI